MKTLLMAVLLGMAISSVAHAEGPARVRVLNNLVSELLNVEVPELEDAGAIRFVNPREGWCFFTAAGQASLHLDDETEPLLNRPAGGERVEAMRYLSTGDHALRVEGPATHVVVRAIPALQHAFYHSGDAWNMNFGPFDDWNYLRAHVLDNVNVIVSGRIRTPPNYEASRSRTSPRASCICSK